MRLIDADKLEPDRFSDKHGFSVSCNQIADAKTIDPFKWVPIKMRALTAEEREQYGDDVEFIYDCPLPDDGQEVLVTTRNDDVEMDVFCRDSDGDCYFETYCDRNDLKAWAELPKPYKEAKR